MRLSEKHLKIVQEVESDGYVWLSHLSKQAIERFRWKTRKGFKGYFKIEGLTFLTKRVADMLSVGSKNGDKPRLTYKEQVKYLEDQLIQLENELYQARGVGKIKVKRRYKDGWNE